MKLKFQNGAVAHARGDIAALFIVAGLAQEIAETTAVTPPEIIAAAWAVGEFQDNGGTPYINGFCTRCKRRHVELGPKASEVAFFHCGVKELPPAFVVEKYRLALKKKF